MVQRTCQRLPQKCHRRPLFYSGKTRVSRGRNAGKKAHSTCCYSLQAIFPRSRHQARRRRPAAARCGRAGLAGDGPRPVARRAQGGRRKAGRRQTARAGTRGRAAGGHAGGDADGGKGRLNFLYSLTPASGAHSSNASSTRSASTARACNCTAGASRSGSPNPAARAARHPAPGMTDASAVLRPAGRTASPPAAGKCRLNFLYSCCLQARVAPFASRYN
jgi:hypothetical protein